MTTLSAVLTLFPLSQSISAEELGSIEITLKKSETAQTVQGVEMGLVQVATGTNPYTSVPYFEDLKIDYSDLKTTSAIEESAENLLKRINDGKQESSWMDFAESNELFFIEGSSTSAGTIFFSNLEEGVFLLFEIDASSYGIIEPAIIYIPTRMADGEIDYSIEVSPKVKPITSIPDNPDNLGSELDVPNKEPAGNNPGSTTDSSVTTKPGSSTSNIGSNQNDPLSSNQSAKSVNTSVKDDSQSYTWMIVGAGTILIAMLLSKSRKQEKQNQE